MKIIFIKLIEFLAFFLKIINNNLYGLSFKEHQIIYGVRITVEYVSSISDFRLSKEQKTFAKLLEKSVSKSLHSEKIHNTKLKRIYARPLDALIASNFGPPIGSEQEFMKNIYTNKPKTKAR